MLQPKGYDESFLSKPGAFARELERLKPFTELLAFWSSRHRVDPVGRAEPSLTQALSWIANDVQ